MRYEYTCVFCGKPAVRERLTGRYPEYCSVTCRRKAQKSVYLEVREEQEKARRIKEQMAASAHPTDWKKQLVAPERCEQCRYGVKMHSKIWCCGYSDITGQTRLAQHPGGLTENCEEFLENLGDRMRPGKKPPPKGDQLRYYEIDPDLERLQEKIRKFMEE